MAKTKENLMITLKTLPTASAQEVFDQVVMHLLTQMKESLTNGCCAYRGEHGRTCAAGCLIADDEYNFNMEEKDWYGVVQAGYAPESHKDLIKRLQVVHDRIKVIDWCESLKDIATDYDLSFENVQRFLDSKVSL